MSPHRLSSKIMKIAKDIIALVVVAGLSIGITFLCMRNNSSENEGLYKEEFKKLIEQNKFDILTELSEVENRISKDIGKVARKEKALKTINDSLKKYPGKYEKNRHDVDAIADDSLRNAFTNEFK